MQKATRAVDLKDFQQNDVIQFLVKICRCSLYPFRGCKVGYPVTNNCIHITVVP